MNPLTHLFISWSVANVDSLERRDRLMVTVGGLLPDVDAVGIIPELISGGKIDWYSRYHHILAHNFMPCVLGLIAVILIARKKIPTKVGITHPVPSGHPSQEGILPKVPSKKRGFRGVFYTFLYRKKFLTTLLFIFAFHIHLFCDIIGARGPEGYQWPIPYLWPFNPDFQITCFHQWLLNAWLNMVITVFFIIITIWLARVKGYSIFSLVSDKIDKAFVETIQKRLK
jgi:hypothetical protein